LSSSWKSTYITSDFGQNILGCASTHSWYPINSLQGFLEMAHALSDFLIHP
jgi:hypothetical protein